MQIANRLTAAASGDGLNNLAGRNAGQASAAGKDEQAAQALAASFFDPTPRVALSADALLYLSQTRKAAEGQPPLTRDEWNNRLSPQLASREYQAFGRFLEIGDHQAYYKNFIDYYDGLRAEDQDSLRYFGTREAAVAGLRSLEYDQASGADGESAFQTLVSVLLEEDKTAQSEAPVHPSGRQIFGWDLTSISYEDEQTERRSVSEIERLYAELM
ncbi:MULTISPECIES: biotin biosynthesis protein BioC [unclassified Ensifer]|uniref:biotin biosynthesis protein BioC n=1 Tax=unclassified Ensifer TaxID=2633371 RepID=UPI00081328E2|nr:MULTISPECIES: biotin biosynthesis protein BioC [unclassified Ensifer]OCP00955.1 biotin biosynthesis protein BioC [Ensifer sp. LC11]OCP01527.1 biotin biosynthesis protein BioC [Ensifer sp. LC13]OCP02075.1 biotin biosynthesis protein BioC [Ensifer sp. LC14]OCP30093.1 biotin biosynthesis protein BioC [Ensifer sp. LC499]